MKEILIDNCQRNSNNITEKNVFDEIFSMLKA